MLLPAIIKRRSIREYDTTKTVSEIVLQEIIKAAQFAPTAKHNCAVEFIVIKNQATKEQLFQITGPVERQKFVLDAPVLLIPILNSTKSVAPVQDLSIASAFIMLQATELGLGTVWKNLSPEQISAIKKLLRIPDNYVIVNFIPIGYAVSPLPEHTAVEFSQNKIHQEYW